MSTRAAIIALALGAQALVAGCGRVDLATADPSLSYVPTSPQVEQTQPVVVSPTPAPIPAINPPLQPAQLNAALTSFGKPGFGGFIGHASAHVTVTNPSNVALTGTVTVQFTDSGKPQGSPQTQQVSIPAMQNQTFTFTEAVDFHFVDSASVSVTTNVPASTPATNGIPGISVPASSGLPGY